MEISYKIMTLEDEKLRPLVDMILDKAGQKGTGKWTAQISYDLEYLLHQLMQQLRVNNYLL